MPSTAFPNRTVTLPSSYTDTPLRLLSHHLFGVPGWFSLQLCPRLQALGQETEDGSLSLIDHSFLGYIT